MEARYVHDLLELAVHRSPGACAVSDQAGSWSYLELWERSHQFSAWLQSVGVRAGDRVVCRITDQSWTVAALYGTLLAGASFVPINMQMKDFQLRRVFVDADPVLILAETSEAVRLSDLTDSRVATIDDVEDSATDWRIAKPVAIAADVPAVLIYTSGSTAQPKAVVCPHSSVLFAAQAISDRLKYRPSDVILVCVPLSFDYGLYQVLLAAISGAELAISKDAAGPAIWDEICERQATVIPVVPSLATILVTLFRRRPVPNVVRLFTNTGAAIPSWLIRDLRALFPNSEVVLMYGITECKRVSIGEPGLDLVKPGSVGRPLAGTEVRIVDKDGTRLGPGELGEIVVRGPNVMSGYWRSPDQTTRCFTREEDGVWAFWTSDYGYLDTEGYLYFCCREGDWFKRLGSRVSCAEVEAAARDIPGVNDAVAVVPRDDGVFVLIAMANIAVSRLLRELSTRLERAKVPDRCVVLERFPLTTNGKTDRSAILKMAAETDWRR